jgi:hypothetical protein
MGLGGPVLAGRKACTDKLQQVELSKKNHKARLSAVLNLACLALLCAMAVTGTCEPPDNATAIRKIDAAVKWRIDHIAEYTDTETYKVFRGKDETNPVAQMKVKTTYRPEMGKSYQILSESGSGIILKFLLHPLLENEKEINDPAKVSSAWIVSANYDMQLKPGGPVEQDGRECWVLSIVPHHKAPNLIEGTLWVDAKDFTVVRLEGVTSKSPSFWASPAHVMRQYAEMDGFSQATHAWAESKSLFGTAVITIDYEGYQIQTR